MSDETKLIHIESEIASIKIAQASQEGRLAALQSDIKELKAHDSKFDERQNVILDAIRSLADKILPLSTRIDSAERKILAVKEDAQASASKLASQNDRQLDMLREIQDEQIRRAAEKAYGEKALSRLPLLLTLVTALGAVLNWYLSSKGK